MLLFSHNKCGKITITHWEHRPYLFGGAYAPTHPSAYGSAHSLPGNPATVGAVTWPLAGDIAGYRLRRPKLIPVSLISMVIARLDSGVTRDPIYKYLTIYPKMILSLS